jgi:hypothetical protein
MTAEKLRLVSPVAIPEDPDRSLSVFLDTLYDKDERIALLGGIVREDGISLVGMPPTRHVSEILDDLTIPGKMERAGHYAFRFLRVNPVVGTGTGRNGHQKVGEYSSYRYTMLKLDPLEQHDELSVLSNLPVPVSALIEAQDGFYTVLHVGALNRTGFRVITGEMLTSLNWLGCSKSLTSPAGISWLPGSSGPGGSQCARLLYLNPRPDFKAISEKPSP